MLGCMDHSVTCADCLDEQYGLPSLPTDSIDVTITDPPFEAECHTLQRRTKRAGADGSWNSFENEALSFAAITPEIRAAVAREIARVTKRWVIVFCQIEAAMEWRRVFEAEGLVYKRTGLWIKPDGQPQYTGDRPGMGYETILCMHKKGRSRWNGGGRHGVWTFNKIGPMDRKRIHETQKPVALMEALVRDFSDPGEVILDPFTGSATTGVAAKRLGRSFRGWEMDETWAQKAAARLGETKEQLTLERAPKPKQLAFA